MNDLKKISQLIAKKKLIGLDSEEEKKFQHLMQEPANKALYDELDDIDLDSEIKLLNQLSATNKKTIRLPQFLKYAAAVLIGGVFIATGAWLFNQNFKSDQNAQAPTKSSVLITSNNSYALNKQERNYENDNVTIDKEGHISYETVKAIKTSYHTIKACDTANVSVTLLDGTKVILNVNSELSYKVPFDKDGRQVKLIGEAYFNVAHNEQQPFIVNTKEQKVKVLGTSFNVRAYENSNQVVTTLVEGKISAQFKSTHSNNYETILSPNQQLILDKKTNKAQVIEVDTYPVIAWSNNRFVFRNKELKEIMASLSKWYNVKINYEDDRLKDQVFSLDIARYKSINEVLTIMEKTNTVKFNTINKNILVQRVK